MTLVQLVVTLLSKKKTKKTNDITNTESNLCKNQAKV